MPKISKEQLLQLDQSLYQEVLEIEASYWKGGTLSVHELGHAHGRGIQLTASIDHSTPLLAKALVRNEN